MASVSKKNVKKVKSRRKINKIKKETIIDYIKNMLNNKGFTLIEVLATIFVVSLIFGVGFYFVTKTINDSKEKTKLISLSNIKSAALLYAKEYLDEVPWREEKDQSGNFTGNYTACILVSDLIDVGFLDEEKVRGIVKEKNIILKKNSNGTIVEEKLDDSDMCLNNGIKIPTSREYCNKVTYTGNPIALLDVDDLSNSLLKQKPNGFSFTINNEIINAGQYEIIARLDSNQEWKDGKAEDKKIICTVDKAVPYFAMHPTGISSDDIKIGGGTSTVLISGVNGSLSVSNSNSDYVSATLSSNYIEKDVDVNLQIGFLATKKTNSYIRVTLTPDNIQNYKDVTLTYTIGDVEKKKVTKPTDAICANPSYNGESQLLVSLPSNDSGYTLFDVYGTNIGNYEVTAKLNYGYVWNDGSFNDVKIGCSIDGSYKINFNGNGSTSGSMSTLTCIYNQSCTLTANAFTRTGYTFAGWAESSSGAVKYTNGQSVTNLATSGTVNLYAVWKVKTLKITFNCNGGAGGNTQTFTYGVAGQTFNHKCSRTGYTGAKWYWESTGVTGGYEWNSGVAAGWIDSYSSGNTSRTLYAKWTANTYTIIFSKNHSQASGSMSNQAMTYGTAKNLTSNAFTRTGYTFAGWNTKADGTGTNYSNGQSVNNLATSGTVNLYAKWTAKSVNVTFNCNGGTGGGSQTFTYGVANQKFGKTCTRGGYTMVGWAATSTATSKNWDTASDVSNDWINLYSPSKTIYAVWEAVKPSITFSPNGGTHTGSTTVTITCTSGAGVKSFTTKDDTGDKGKKKSTTTNKRIRTITLVSTGSRKITATCTSNNGESKTVTKKFTINSSGGSGSGGTGGTGGTTSCWTETHNVYGHYGGGGCKDYAGTCTTKGTNGGYTCICTVCG